MIFSSNTNKNNYIKIIPKENIFVFIKFRFFNYDLFIKMYYNSGDIWILNILFANKKLNSYSLLSAILIIDQTF